MAGFLSLQYYHQTMLTADDCRMWMRGNGLLAWQMVCQRCSIPVEEHPYARLQDGVRWDEWAAAGNGLRWATCEVRKYFMCWRKSCCARHHVDNTRYCCPCRCRDSCSNNFCPWSGHLHWQQGFCTEWWNVTSNFFLYRAFFLVIDY